MFQNFRLSMAWLHTWFGLVLGFVLMAAFFFGALSVFDREIDRWSQLPNGEVLEISRHTLEVNLYSQARSAA